MPELPAGDLEHVLAHTESLWAEARGERFFVTGGTGFVGKWLLESLLGANQRLNLRLSVVVLSRDPAAFAARAPHLANNPALALVAGDAAEFEFPAGRFGFTVHAASGRYASDGSVSVFARDLAATRRVLEFCGASGVRRLLFTSSGAVYGKQPANLTHVDEDYPGAPPPVNSDSAYGTAKRASEFLCAGYAQTFGLVAAIARLFAFTGPHLPLEENFAVGNFVRDALEGGPVRVTGDGTLLRSYLYGADLAIWLWTMLFRGRSSYPYNVGSPEAVSILDLARLVASVAGPDIGVTVARQPEPGVAPARYVPSTLRAEHELGLRVWVPLEEGIRRMWNWNRAARPDLALRQVHCEL